MEKEKAGLALTRPAQNSTKMSHSFYHKQRLVDQYGNQFMVRLLSADDPTYGKPFDGEHCRICGDPVKDKGAKRCWECWLLCGNKAAA